MCLFFFLHFSFVLCWLLWLMRNSLFRFCGCLLFHYFLLLWWSICILGIGLVFWYFHLSLYFADCFATVERLLWMYLVFLVKYLWNLICLMESWVLGLLYTYLGFMNRQWIKVAIYIMLWLSLLEQRWLIGWIDFVRRLWRKTR